MAQISNEILGGKNPAISQTTTIAAWGLSYMVPRLRRLCNDLIKQVDLCHDQIETKLYKKLLDISGKPHEDNREVVQMLFAVKDEIPLKDCSSQAQVNISELEKVVIILVYEENLQLIIKLLALSLKELCRTDNFRFLIPEIENALCVNTSSTTDLKVEALILTRLVLASNSPTVLYPYIEAISRPAISAVRDSFYKVTAEALRVCGEIVCAVRLNTEGCNFNFEPYVYPIYNAIMERLTNQDQDQEVKKCAISCMGLVLPTFGDNLGAELPACLTILANRMGNEITRLAAVMIIWGSKAFPFSTSKEKELWKEQNWSLKFLLDCVDPLLLKWVDEGRNFCLYGSDDLYWTREFNSRMDEIRNAGLNFQESTLIGIFEESLQMA
ncbi:hypothetical protein POM88_015668 [Heracleum sosnowskyi]|uniref:Sieve element occlusion C-terminal domain-containing protein n=1 Tax=Heracleum sosnowskyi TaxID=360622 RepID=A0AAD8IP52_9APIA|nr:hypothetical protein POM88_015668 [Heracleum sosnowskyi]